MPTQITALRGEHAGKSFPLGDAIISFGRSSDNIIVITGARVSRHHAQIQRSGAVYILTDLSSSNGTLVNGQRITAPHHLQAGDTFEIGDVTFRFDAAL